MSEQVMQIFIPSIVPNPDNRRVGGFDPVKLDQLAASIKDVGVQQPIIVRKSLGSGGYELVAGERRMKACVIAGLKEIPAIVRELDDLQVLKIQTIENLQREDVHPLDEADGFARLMEKAGYEVEQVAAELGKSASYVYQRLKLRDLVPGARDLFVKGDITAGHAMLIARLAPKQQEQVLKEIAYRDDRSRSSWSSHRPAGSWTTISWCRQLAKGARARESAELRTGRFGTTETRMFWSPRYLPKRREKEEQKRKLNEVYRRVVYGKTVEAAAKQRDLDTELLRMAVMMFATGGNEAPYEVGKLEGWEEDDDGTARIKGMDRKSLLVMLVKLTIAGDVVDRYWSNRGDVLMAAAKTCKVDFKAARKLAAAELKTSKPENKADTGAAE